MTQTTERLHPHQEVVWLAIPTGSAVNLLEAVAEQLPDPKLNSRARYTNVTGVIGHNHFDRNITVRISDTEIASTEPDILASLVKARLAKPTVFSFAYSPTAQIREVMDGSRSDISGHKIVGAVLRRERTDFFAFTFEHRNKARFVNPAALVFADELAFKMLSFEVYRNRQPGKGVSALAWDGRVLVESDQPITGVQAIDRYERIRAAFGIELVPYSDRSLRNSGFSPTLRNLYRDKNEVLPKAA